MCTISWLYTPQGYHVFFNRDEQKSRPIALPPEKKHVNGLDVIMPVDPQGEGTWCAVNELGLTVALLNFYQGRMPKGRLISRGKLVKHCSGLKAVEEVMDYVNSLNLNRYAPFSLLCFSPYGLDQEVKMIRWDGKTLGIEQQASPLISSAKHFDEVVASRHDCYHRRLSKDSLSDIAQGPDNYIYFHASHEPEASAFSVCMHREDAHTVSFSHISVGEGHVEYRYSDGAPCRNEIRSYGLMPLRKSGKS